MRKILSIICALILALLVPAGFFLSRVLPVNTAGYISKKYDGWTGVLQAWIFCDWNPGGSFISWLNGCAAEFEKQHEGVYLEFMPVTREAMSSLGSNGIHPPQLVLFSTGIIPDPTRLADLGFPDALRKDLRRDARAIPVAMDGYAWAMNPDATGTLCDPENIPGVIGLLGANMDAPVQTPVPGMDLGLPAFAGTALNIAPDAMEIFLDGDARRICVDGAKLGRLLQLREEGRGPDWRMECGGGFVCADRLLFIGAVSDHEETLQLCRAFAEHLLCDESQDALRRIGAYSVTGRSIYPSQDVRSMVQAQIQSLPVAAGNPFSEHCPPNAAAIVRSTAAGAISPREAAAKFGFSLRLTN